MDQGNPGAQSGLQREKGGPGEVKLHAQLCARYREKPGNPKGRVGSGHLEATSQLQLGRKAP